MTLNRALEMCHAPIQQSRSHLVKVDRYALKHVLADREEKLGEAAKEVATLNGEIAKLKLELKDAEEKIVKLKNKA